MVLETTYLSVTRDLRKYQAEYTRLHDAQKGLCAVCDCPLLKVGRPLPGSRKLIRGVLDHCHKSGIVRGLLCPRCNTVVGYVEHGLLVRARRYVDSFPSFVSRSD
jgi:hypothetical protein